MLPLDRHLHPRAGRCCVARDDETTAASRSRSCGSTSAEDDWRYPIELGDPRTYVRRVLGPPESSSTAIWDEFPRSGVSAMFDADNRLIKLSFAGKAHTIGFPYIPSERAGPLGLSGQSTEQDFRRSFGIAVAERQVSVGAQVWDAAAGRRRIRQAFLLFGGREATSWRHISWLRTSGIEGILTKREPYRPSMCLGVLIHPQAGESDFQALKACASITTTPYWRNSRIAIAAPPLISTLAICLGDRSLPRLS